MPPVQTKSRMTRWRAGSLIGVHLLIGLHFLHWKIAGRTLAPVEPSEMFDTLHLGVITVGFLFIAGVVLATSVAGRFFCSWGCHILALQDLCAWILKKLGISTKPIRSRVLLWVPPAAVAYLFVWPQVLRWMRGEGLPPLHVISDPDGWTSFTTTDLLRSFPGLWMTLFTFAICGFAIVYFLGSRSFCSYACPYGAIFAAAERVAPLRIIAGPGECSQCGLCIASCPSSIRVVEEVQQFGAVMSSNCMKDLDCVTVCPTDALKLGLTKPPLLRSWWSPRSLKKTYDFSLGEDLLLGGIFMALLPVIRGLYEAISLLLALALTALLAYFAILSLRLVREPGVVLSQFQLKVAGRLTAPGWVFAAVSATLGLLAVHSGFIRYHTFAAKRTLADMQIVTAALERPLEADDSPRQGADSQAANLQASSTALFHLQQAYWWGLFRPIGLRRQLAAAYQQTGSTVNARVQLHALLTKYPDDLESRLRLGQSWLQDGRMDLAKKQFQKVVSATDGSLDSNNGSLRDRTLRGSAHFFLGDVEVKSGNQRAALQQFELAAQNNPQNVEAHLALGAMQAAAGQLEQAITSFETSVGLRPASAAAYNNLGAILVRLDRQQEALQHYRKSLAILPRNPLAHYNVALLLARMGELDEAEQAFRQALVLQPAYASAHAGLAQVLERRGESEQAAWHREQAGLSNGQVQP